MTTSRKILLPIIIVAMLLALAGMLFLSFANTDSQAVALAEEVNHTPATATTHTNHDGWTKVTADIGTLSNGNYYLDSDITLSADLTVTGTVTLCLNGHILRGTGKGATTTISVDGTLANFTLEDCNTSVAHKYYADDANNGVYVIEGAADFDAGYAAATTKGTILGGIVTGASVENQGAILILSNPGVSTKSSFTLNGGTIAGNSGAIAAGAMIFNSYFVMNGGAIIGNNTAANGVVYLEQGSTFDMQDGIISYNAAKDKGTVFLLTNERETPTFTMNGGTISNNVGSGVYAQNGRFKMYGGTISNNTTTGNGGGVCSYYGVEIKGGTISGNTATNGGGVYIDSGIATIDGGTISGNTATAKGGGAFLKGSISRVDSATRITGNTAAEGGGVYFEQNSIASLPNCILGDNTNAAGQPDEVKYSGKPSWSTTRAYFTNAKSMQGIPTELWAYSFYITPNLTDYYIEGAPYVVLDDWTAGRICETWNTFAQQALESPAHVPAERKLALTDSLVQEFMTTSGYARLPMAMYYLESDVTLSTNNVVFGIGNGEYNRNGLDANLYTLLDLNGHTLSTADGSTAIKASVGQNINIVDSVGNGRLEGGILLGKSTPVTVVSGTVARIVVNSTTSKVQLNVGNSGKVEELYVDGNFTFNADTLASQLVLDKITVASGTFTLQNGKVSVKLIDVLAGSCVLQASDITITDVYEFHVASGAQLNMSGAGYSNTSIKVITEEGSVVLFGHNHMVEDSVIYTSGVTWGSTDFSGCEFYGDITDGSSSFSMFCSGNNTINGNVTLSDMDNSSVFTISDGTLTINGSLSIANQMFYADNATIKVTGDVDIINNSEKSFANIDCDGTITVQMTTCDLINVKASTVNTVSGSTVSLTDCTVDTVVAEGAVVYKQGNNIQSVSINNAALTIDTTDEVVNSSIFTMDTATTVTVQSGTFVVADLDLTGKLGSGNGTIELGTGAALTVSDGTTVNNNIVVTSGTFAMTAGNLGGRLSKAQDATGTISVSGGNFAYPVDSTYLAEGSIAVLLEDGEAGYNAQYPYVIYTLDADGTINSVIVAWQTTEFTYNGKVLDAVSAGQTITDGEGNPIEQTYTIEYSYVLDGVTYYGLPKNAGTYDFTVTLYFKNTDATTAYTATGALSGITILPKELTVTWDKSTTSFTYDGKEHAPNAQVLFGVVMGDSIGLAVQGATNAGTHTAQATITNGNYVLANPECQYTINKKVVEVVWGKKVEFVYNGQAQAPTATADSGIEGVELTLTVAGNTNAGDYTATATESSGNFEFSNATLDYTIAKKRVAVVWSNTELTYTGEAIAPTATVETGVEGETLTLTITGGQTKNGTYSAAASIDNPNYELTNYYTTYTIAGGPEGGMSGLATAMLIITILGVLGAGGTFAFVMIKSKRG